MTATRESTFIPDICKPCHKEPQKELVRDILITVDELHINFKLALSKVRYIEKEGLLEGKQKHKKQFKDAMNLRKRKNNPLFALFFKIKSTNPSLSVENIYRKIAKYTREKPYTGNNSEIYVQGKDIYFKTNRQRKFQVKKKRTLEHYNREADKKLNKETHKSTHK